MRVRVTVRVTVEVEGEGKGHDEVRMRSTVRVNLNEPILVTYLTYQRSKTATLLLAKTLYIYLKQKKIQKGKFSQGQSN